MFSSHGHYWLVEDADPLARARGFTARVMPMAWSPLVEYGGSQSATSTFGHKHYFADHAALRQQLLGLSGLGQGESLSDDRLELLFLK